MEEEFSEDRDKAIADFVLEGDEPAESNLIDFFVALRRRAESLIEHHQPPEGEYAPMSEQEAHLIEVLSFVQAEDESTDGHNDLPPVA